MSLKISKVTIENNRQQWLFTINKYEDKQIGDNIAPEYNSIMFFTLETVSNIAQFKHRLLTGLDATLSINDAGNKSYIAVVAGWCEFYIYTAHASMMYRVTLEDCADELISFIDEYSDC